MGDIFAGNKDPFFAGLTGQIEIPDTKNAHEDALRGANSVMTGNMEPDVVDAVDGATVGAQLTQEQVNTEAATILSNQDIDVDQRTEQLRGLASKSDQADLELALTAYENNLLQQDGRINLLGDLDKTKGKRTQRRADVMAILHETTADFDASTGRATAEFFEDALIPGFYHTLGNVLSSVVGDGVNYLKPQDAINRFREVLLDPGTTDEEAKQLTQAAVNEIMARRGHILESDYQAYALIQTLFGNLDPNDPAGMAESVFAVLDYLPVVGGAARILRKGAKLLPVRTPPGSVADIATDTVTGARRLDEAVRAQNMEAINSTLSDMGEIVGDLHVHKSEIEELTSKPFIGDYQLSSEAREAAKAREIDRVGVLNNQVKISDFDGGFDYTGRVGKNGETGWADEAQAATARDLLREDGLDANVVKSADGDEWFVDVVGEHHWTFDDVGGLGDDVLAKGGVFRKFFGKNSTFNEHYTKSGDVSFLNSASALDLMQRIKKPFDDAGKGAQTRALELLERGEDAQKWYKVGDPELASLGREAQGAYLAVKAHQQTALAVRNQFARESLHLQGYRMAEVGGVDSVLRAVDNIPENIRSVVDQTGTPVRARSLDEGDRVFRVLGGYKQGKSTHDYVVVRAGNDFELNNLPHQVVNDVPGYIFRQYDAPVYIRSSKQGTRNGEPFTIPTTVATSPNRKKAEAWIKAQDDPSKFKLEFAREISDDLRGLDHVSDLMDQGLMFMQGRKAETLLDMDGGLKPRLGGIADSIEATARSAELAAGVDRWTAIKVKQWENEFKDLFPDGFNMAAEPRLGATADQATIDRGRAAIEVWRQIRRTNGLDKGQGNVMLQSYRNQLGDAIGGRIGDEITGRTSKVIGGAKTATFSVLLAGNPIRHRFLQMTNIPLYLSVRHAGKYLLSGKGIRDWNVISASDMFGRQSGLAVAKSLGMSDGDALALLKQWDQSGLKQSIDSHLLTLDTGFTGSRAGAKGQVARKAEHVLRFMKKHGIDAGITADKRAAFLVQRNKWIVDHKGTLPTKQRHLDDIRGQAEGLTLSQNQTDTLIGQRGAFGMFTQFLSHQIKMTSRVAGFDRRIPRDEWRKLVAYNTVFYGTAGWGVDGLIDKLITESGVDPAEIPDDVRTIMHQGLVGAAVNEVLGLADEDGTDTRINVSGSIAPVGYLGDTVSGTKELLTGLLSLDLGAFGDTRFDNFAVKGLTVGLYNAAKFAYNVSGKVDMPADDKALAITAQFFKQFPMSNNIIKTIAALNLGHKFDSRGRPVVEATKGEAIASLFGIRSYSEEAVMDLYRKYYGQFQGGKEDALSGEMGDAVNDTMEWLLPLLTSTGNFNPTAIADMMENHAVAMNTALPDAAQAIYFRALKRRLLKELGGTKGERIVETLMKGVGRERGLVPGEDAINRMRNYEVDIPQVGKVVDRLEQYIERVNI